MFLDRDGTIVEEIGYVTRPDDLRLLPGAAAAIARFNAAGVRVFVITNQGCVAKGLITEPELEDIHLRLVALLAAEGARVDGIYHCPHHPDFPPFGCRCRKPEPGLLEQAAREHGVELTDSVVIGDTARDVGAGRAVGAKTVLVRSGHPGEAEADWIVRDLEEASRVLLAS